MKKFSYLLLFSVALGGFFSCTKSNSTSQPVYQVKYADSILYLKNQANDYIVLPVGAPAGTYSAFPEGIEIDDNTGAINVTRSETGLRYRITYTSPEGETSSTLVVISGLQFEDKFYHLSLNDTIASPIYNNNPANAVPVNGSIFDDGNGANTSGCSVRTNNGQIVLSQTVLNGLFGNPPTDDAKKEIDILYRLNDQSDKALNKIRVKLYYYSSMSTVAADLLQTLQDRQESGVFLKPGNGIFPTAYPNYLARRTSKPRPPCVVVVGQ